MADTSLRIIITAVNNVKAELQKIRQDVKTTVDSMNGLGPVAPARLNEELKRTQKEAAGTREEIQKLSQSTNILANGFQRLASIARFVAGGFLALKSVQFLKDLADTAARTETLGLVLNTVGNNAGYTATQLEETEKQVMKLGITAAAARESLTKLIQSRIPLDFAAPLARAAQDLAVVSGMNSSDTFTRLITNIQQLDTMGLRFMGLIINKEQVFANAARAAGKELDENAKKIAFANGVLAESAKLNGVYETSLNSVGKMLGSLPRYVENLKVSLGNNLLPVYTEIVRATTNVLATLDQLARAMNGEDGVGAFDGLARAIRDTGKALVDMINWIKENRDTFANLWEMVKAVTLAFIAFKAFFAGLAVYAAFAKAIGGISAAISAMMVAIRAVTLAGMIGGFSALLPVLAPTLPVLFAIAAAVAAIVGVWSLWNKVAGESKQNLLDTNALLDNYSTNLTKSSAIGAQITGIAKQIEFLQNRLLGNLDQAERTRIKNEIRELNDRLEALKKERLKYEEEANKARDALNKRKLTDDQKKRKTDDEERAAAPAKEFEEAAKAAQIAQEAMAQAGLKASELSTGVNEKLTKAAEGFIGAMYGMEQGSKEASNTLDGLLKEYQELVQAVQSPADLAKLEEIGRFLAVKAREAGKNYDAEIAAAQRAAGVNVSKRLQEIRAGGAAALALENAYQKATADMREAFVKVEVEYERIANEQTTKVLEDRYANGMILTADYYRERQRLARSDLDGELRILRQAGEALAQELAREQDPNKRISLSTQIFQNEQRIRQAQANFSNKAADQRRQQERDELEQQRTKTRLQIELATDGAEREAALIASVNLQYAEQLQKLGHIEGVRDLLAKKRDLDIQKIKLDEANRAHQFRIELLRAELNLRSVDIENGALKGDLTSLEVQEKRNQLAREHIDLLEEDYRRQIRIANELKQIDEAGSREALQRALSLRAEIEQTRNSIVGMGDDLRRTFTDSLQDGIQSLINGTKSLKDVLKNIGNSVANQITAVISRDLAEQITRTINRFGQVDGKGSFFDQIMSFITGKKPEAKAAAPSPEAQAQINNQNTLAQRAETLQQTLLGQGSPIVGKTEQVRAEAASINAAVQKLVLLAEQASAKAASSSGLPQQPETNLPPEVEEAMKSIAEEARASKATGSVAGLPRGVRNNNPGNLEFLKTNPFLGQIGTDGRFGTFDTAENGIRALAKNLLAKQDRGMATVAEIIEAWAPSKENGSATKTYIETVAKEVGVGINERIDLRNRETLEAFTKAIIKFENGKQPYDEAVIDSAVDKALGATTKEKPTAPKTPELAKEPTAQDLGAIVGSGLESTISSTLAQMGPMGQIAALLLRSSNVGTKLGSSFGGFLKDIFSGSGVGPGKGTFGVVDESLSFPGTQSLGKVSEASESVFDALVTSFETNASSVSSDLISGGLGIGDIFDTLGGFLEEGFDALASMFSGSGASSGTGGGGGWGEMLGSFLSTVFAAEGGLLVGPSHSSGGIPVEAEGGEYIVNKHSTSKWLPILHAINEESTGLTSLRVPKAKKFADGGLVDAMIQGSSRAGVGGTIVPRVTVVQSIQAQDVNSFRKSQDQIAVETRRAIDRAVRRNG